MILFLFTSTLNYGRFYQVGEHQFPGVGTILNATDSHQQQEFWQQWRASPENVAYSDKAKDRGSLFHAMVEHHFGSGNYQ